MKFKTLLVALTIEGILYLGYLYIHPNEYRALKAHQDTIVLLQQNIQQLKENLINLDTFIEDWHRYPWYAERIVREELQYILPSEEIYFYQEA